MNQEKQEILDWLYSLHRFGIQPGLERISTLLDFLGNPEKSLKAIHITGTNGKGTTAVTTASILMEAGYKVGLYTSPHLVDFNERVQINGELIPDDVLVDLAKKLIPLQEEIGATFFELTTAIAFKYFTDRKVDYAVIEAGMGGLNDATNVLNPLLSIITPISLEHQEYLGDTLEKIAEDKSGIIKSESISLISDDNVPLKSIFINKAKENNNSLNFLDDIVEILDTNFENFQTHIRYRDKRDNSEHAVSMPFLGEHQARNVLTAMCVTQLLFPMNKLESSIIAEGIAKANQNFRFHGRFQVYSQEPLIILDVAHNPAAFDSLISNMEEAGLNSKMTLVLALMADKDIEGIAKLISGKFRKYIITKPKIERAAEPEYIKQKLLEINPDNDIAIIKKVPDAVKFVKESKQPTLFAGSFYLIGEVLEGM